MHTCPDPANSRSTPPPTLSPMTHTRAFFVSREVCACALNTTKCYSWVAQRARCTIYRLSSSFYFILFYLFHFGLSDPHPSKKRTKMTHIQQRQTTCAVFPVHAIVVWYQFKLYIFGIPMGLCAIFIFPFSTLILTHSVALVSGTAPSQQRTRIHITAIPLYGFALYHCRRFVC